jgi:hypothetical protein
MNALPKLALFTIVCLPILGSGQQPATSAKEALSKQPVTPVNQAVGFSSMSTSWNFSAGYQHRQMGELNFLTGSRAAQGSLPWMAGRGRSGSSGSVANSTTSSTTTGSNANVGTAGPATINADRTYSNGYVNQDAGTPTFGDTWFWGYNQASQVSGGTLSYQTTAPGTVNTTTTTGGGGSMTTYSPTQSSTSSLSQDLNWSTDLSGSGWFGRLESPAIFSKDALAVSVELGYSYAGADTGRRNNSVFNAHQQTRTRTTTTTTPAVTAGSVIDTTTLTITDRYDVSGFLVPGAPYTGTLVGPGSTITNRPASRTVTPNTVSTGTASNGTAGPTSVSSSERITTADFFSTVSETLDVDLHTLSLGPHVSWEKSRVRLGLSTGLAINFANWDAGYREDLYLSQNGGKSRRLASYQNQDSGSEVLPGFYLEANANVRLTQHLSLFAGGRYDWAGTLDGQVGPSAFSLELGGWTAMGGVTVSF